MATRALRKTWNILSRPVLQRSAHRLPTDGFASVRFLQQTRRAAAVPGTAAPGAGGAAVESVPTPVGEAGRSVEQGRTSNGNSSTPPTALPSDATDYSGDGTKDDWSRSYFGLSSEPFPKEVADILQAPLDPLDIEMKPGMGCFSASKFYSKI